MLSNQDQARVREHYEELKSKPQWDYHPPPHINKTHVSVEAELRYQNLLAVIYRHDHTAFLGVPDTPERVVYFEAMFYRERTDLEGGITRHLTYGPRAALNLSILAKQVQTLIADLQAANPMETNHE